MIANLIGRLSGNSLESIINVLTALVSRLEALIAKRKGKILLVGEEIAELQTEQRKMEAEVERAGRIRERVSALVQ